MRSKRLIQEGPFREDEALNAGTRKEGFLGRNLYYRELFARVGAELSR